MGESDIDLTFVTTFGGVTLDATGNGSFYVIYKVGAIEGQEYRVDVAGRLEMIMDMDISGSYLEMQPVSGSMHVTMVVKVDGGYYYTKDELALTRGNETVDLDFDFSGSATAAGQTQSFSASIDGTGDMSITFDPPLDLFDFPISVGESWNAMSTARVTGSVSGNLKMEMAGQSFSKPISESLDETVYVSLSVSCPGTVDIPLVSTCYKLDVTGRGVREASPFMPATTLYYSPDRGFIVASEIDLGEAISGVTLGSEESIPYAGGITEAMGTITPSPVSEQEARAAIEGLGAKGIDIVPVLIGVIVAVIIVVIAIVIIALAKARGRRALPT